MSNYSTFFKKFSAQLQKNLRIAEPLKKYCNFRVGGPADLFFDAKESEELENIVSEAASLGVPFWIIGGGTNTLFRDEGYHGLIIRNVTHDFRFDEKNDHIAAIFDAGISMSECLKMCMANGKIDMQEITPFQGLPGTIGGAVYGNAGCFGQEIGNLVNEVEVLEISNGEVIKGSLVPEFAYRWSSLKEKNALQNKEKKQNTTRIIIVKVHVKLSREALESKTSKSDSRKDIQSKDILHLRASKQPPGYSGGSFFKNPSPEAVHGLAYKTAGQLIEAAGMKGKHRGGAKVSEKHANFILNVGKAQAADILQLAEEVTHAVMSKFGIRLEEEIRII